MARLLPAKRLAEIHRLLRVDGAVRVVDLAERLEVAQETVRRDLKQLAEAGHAIIVHGGATLFGTAVLKHESRDALQSSAETRIAAAAAALITTRVTVMVNSGAEMLQLAASLVPVKSITVVTNSLGVAALLARAGRRVHILPGAVASHDGAVLSAATIEALANFRFDAAFVSAGGLTAQSGLTDRSRLATQFRSRILLSTNKAYVLADSSKFETDAAYPVGHVERITAVITNAQPKPQLRRWLVKRDIQLIVA